MPLLGKVEVDAVRLSNGVTIVTGARATRATVASDYPKLPIGSIYISSVATGGTGRVYVKTSESGGATGTAGDWTKITTSAAD